MAKDQTPEETRQAEFREKLSAFLKEHNYDLQPQLKYALTGIQAILSIVDTTPQPEEEAPKDKE